MAGRRARDLKLLDALDALPRIPFEGTAWRAVRERRDPLQGHPSGGRWDLGTFDVLYTSMEPNGAAPIERRHRLDGLAQGVAPALERARDQTPFRRKMRASSPTMPRRNSSTQPTKMAPVMTVTQPPKPAR